MMDCDDNDDFTCEVVISDDDGDNVRDVAQNNGYIDSFGRKSVWLLSNGSLISGPTALPTKNHFMEQGQINGIGSDLPVSRQKSKPKKRASEISDTVIEIDSDSNDDDSNLLRQSRASREKKVIEIATSGQRRTSRRVGGVVKTNYSILSRSSDDNDSDKLASDLSNPSFRENNGTRCKLLRRIRMPNNPTQKITIILPQSTNETEPASTQDGRSFETDKCQPSFLSAFQNYRGDDEPLGGVSVAEAVNSSMTTPASSSDLMMSYMRGRMSFGIGKRSLDGQKFLDVEERNQILSGYVVAAAASDVNRSSNSTTGFRGIASTKGRMHFPSAESIKTASRMRQERICQEKVAAAADAKVARVKGTLQRKKRGENETSTDKSKNANKNDVAAAQKPKEKSERPMAEALIKTAVELVSLNVVSSLIKITRKSPQAEQDETRKLLEKCLLRQGELSQMTRHLCLSKIDCSCGTFTGESTNVLQLHRELGSSHRELGGASRHLFSCCSCPAKAYKTFKVFQCHMMTQHEMAARRETALPEFLCELCPFGTSHKLSLEYHEKRCEQHFKLAKNLAPRLVDCDVAITFKEKPQIPKLRVYQGPGSVPPSAPKAHVDGEKSLKAPRKVRPPKNSCRFCGILFKTTDECKVHVATVHRKTSSVKSAAAEKAAEAEKRRRTSKCSLCRTELQPREALKHFADHHSVTIVTMLKKKRCYVCEEAAQVPFKNVTLFEGHMLKKHAYHFPSAEKLWAEIFNGSEEREKSSVVPVKPKLQSTSDCDDDVKASWRCARPRCRKQFHSSSFCYRHVVTTHQAAKIECQVCRKMVPAGTSYTKHVKENHVRLCRVALKRVPDRQNDAHESAEKKRPRVEFVQLGIVNGFHGDDGRDSSLMATTVAEIENSLAMDSLLDADVL